MGRKTAGKCVHFTGIQNEACEAGVRYDSFATGPGCRVPCLNDGSRLTCDKRREPTADEIAQSDADMEQVMGKMRLAMTATRAWRTWTKANRVGKQGVIGCPVCKGRLHLSQSAYNGHVWGNCETKGCVQWME